MPTGAIPMPTGAIPMPSGAVGSLPAAFFDGQARWSPAGTLAMIAFECLATSNLLDPTRQRVAIGIRCAPFNIPVWLIPHPGLFTMVNDDRFTHCAENAQF